MTLQKDPRWCPFCGDDPVAKFAEVGGVKFYRCERCGEEFAVGPNIPRYPDEQ